MGDTQQNAAPDESGHAAPAPSDQESEDFLMGQTTLDDGNDPTGEQRLLALRDAARQQLDGLDAEQEPAGEAKAEAPTEQKAADEKQEPAEEPTPLAGKFKSPEELEKAYLEVQSAKGRLAQELGELRTRVRAAEATAQARQDTRRQEQVQTAIEDQRQRIQQHAMNTLGMTEQEASEHAQLILESADIISQTRVGEAEQRYRPVVEQQERYQRAEAIAVELRSEVDPEGNLLRPDWNEVVESKEFIQLYTDRPRILDDPELMDLAYQNARLMRTQSTQQAEQHAQEVKAEIDGRIRQEKAAAATAGGGASARQEPSTNESDDPEWDAVLQAGGGNEFLMGGGD